MEEFRSTEILDKEIQDDARRKADKLIKRADVDGKRLLDEVQNKIERTKNEKVALYTSRIDAYKKDLASALPLEKERFLVSFEADAVNAEISAYISSLPEAKKNELLTKLLARYKDKLSDKKVNVRYYGVTKEVATKTVTSVIAKKDVAELASEDASYARDSVLDTGFIVETTDNTMRCRVTIAELVNDLLDTNRFELASALFPGRIAQ